MTAMMRRQEMKGCIDKIADKDLENVAQILSLLVNMSAHDVQKDYVIDDDLTDEEIESLIKCESEYRDHPEDFVLWKKHAIID